ncbi:energy transducer TonB [Pseudothauera rhizosphaerae]|uniref:energy transducer TonB n=1 Tax=Pseudothauera rhizosphaerae TaxID=2565932 RepID=UPI001E361AA5|nr:energy transducer TonB [Pseudothauera rhizosphaerae]
MRAAGRCLAALLALALHGAGLLAILATWPERQTAGESSVIEVALISAPLPAPTPAPAPAPPAAAPAPPEPRAVATPPRKRAPAPVRKPEAKVEKQAEAVETPSPTALTAADSAAPPEEAAPAPAAADAAPAPAGGGVPSARGTPADEALVAPRFDADYLSNPAPAYPLPARRQRHEGQVTLRVAVSAEGRPLRIEVVAGSGSEHLDRAAREAVAGWRFVPARRGGRAVEAAVLVPIIFRLGAR